MSFYRYSSGPGSSGPGVTESLADGEYECFKHIAEVCGLGPTSEQMAQSVRSFAMARDYGAQAATAKIAPEIQLASKAATFSPSEILGAKQAVPDLSAMGSSFQGLSEMSGHMPNPAGFLKALIEFLQHLFSAAPAEQMAGALPALELNNQAARAAMESEALRHFQLNQ